MTALFFPFFSGDLLESATIEPNQSIVESVCVTSFAHCFFFVCLIFLVRPAGNIRHRGRAES